MGVIQIFVVLFIFLQPGDSFFFPKDDVDENLEAFGNSVTETSDSNTVNEVGWFGFKSANSFIFPTDDDENQNEFSEPVMETRNLDTENVDGWFGLFSKKLDESKSTTSEQESSLPVLSDGWMQKYTEMIEHLSKMKTVLKESTVSKDLLEKYNASLFQLTEIRTRLEATLESRINLGYNSTLQSIDQVKQVFFSYNWYEKYSEALDTLDEVKESIEYSISDEIKTITSTLSGLKKSWEKYSFYNLWQEQYKRLASRNFSWNTTLLDNGWFSSKENNGSLFGSWKSALPTIVSYQDMIKQYLPSLEKAEPVCTSKVFTCPDNKQQFTADACCSPLWLSIGAPLGFGNECGVDLDLMVEQCDIFSCYGLVNGTFNSTDGCTFIPDVLLNYESCVIHDLCYVTPGVTKAECDEVMKDNINKIYCDNVNVFERKLCSIRASLAATALEWTDKYFVAAGIMRDKCQLADSVMTRIWKFSVNRIFRPIF